MDLLNRFIVSTLPLVPKSIVRRVSSRYVAGESLDDAMETVRKLNALGARATLDLLGEDVTSREEASAAADEYVEALERIEKEKLDSNVSVKLTHMGLRLDEGSCVEQMTRIIEAARGKGNFVRIDMEDSSVTSATIGIYRRLRGSFDNVGIVVQAYLRRTLADLVSLRDLRPSVRVCKGIYIEKREIAYKDRDIINQNFALLMDELLNQGSYVGIATHDERVVWEGLRLIHEKGVKKDQYEFQMLLGVDDRLRDILIGEGHPLRIYIPYGKAWYAYAMRRLKENPTIAGYVLAGMLRGNR